MWQVGGGEFAALRSLENYPTNLPLQSSSSFVGRARDVEAIEALLGEHRLVTLTGVEVSNDLSHAAVYFTSHDKDAAAQVALDAAAPRLRGALGRAVRMKQTPALRFMPDPAIEQGRRVDELLREGGVRHDTLDDE